MYFTKQTVVTSSDTADWETLIAARSADINGELTEITISDGGTTDEVVGIYRGSTVVADKIWKGYAPSSQVNLRPGMYLTSSSTIGAAAWFGSTSYASKVPWTFANEKLIVTIGGTALSLTLTLRIKGITSSG